MPSPTARLIAALIDTKQDRFHDPPLRSGPLYDALLRSGVAPPDLSDAAKAQEEAAKHGNPNDPSALRPLTKSDADEPRPYVPIDSSLAGPPDDFTPSNGYLDELEEYLNGGR